MYIILSEIDRQSRFDTWDRVLRAGALGWPWGMGWGTHVHPRLIHVSVWQKPPQYCKVISLQLKFFNNKQINHLKPKQTNKQTNRSTSPWKALLLLLSHFCHVRLCATPWTAAHQAPPSLGFSRQEHWGGLPFTSPMHESEKSKWSRWVVSNSQRPHELQPTRLLHPWDFPGKSTGVGCHCLLLRVEIVA